MEKKTSGYAEPRVVTDISDCTFYHTMEISGQGLVEGIFDLRGIVDEYLGGVCFQGKRVLEMGTADGFLCFEMEKRGAEVVAYDLSERHAWDIVPFAQYDHRQFLRGYQGGARRLNNAFWLNHRLRGSKARMAYGTIYEIPEALGLFDVATLGSLLLHVRDPFGALQRVAERTLETIVISEPFREDPALQLLEKFAGPFMLFCPRPKNCEPKETWWHLPPSLIVRFLEVLGFEKTAVNYYSPASRAFPDAKFYTVVGTRTRDRSPD